MTRTLGIGVIGCGNISAAYFRLAPLFKGLEVRACTDINMAAAEARAKEFGVRAEGIDALLADPDVDVVINLTIPEAHYGVTLKALEAGKHVYSEKPFVLTIDEGKRLKEIADAKNLRVGSAPDTFLGGAHQLARKLVDDGSVGTITSGTAHVMSHGMENWHPNPDFFFLPGAGPVLDVGPYYVANLINLIGPVKPRRRPHQLRHAHPHASPRKARSRARPSRSRPRPPSTRSSSSPAAPPSRWARAGTSGATATGRWSSTAPTAPSSSPTRTGSAARSSSSAPTARRTRCRCGTTPSPCRTTSARTASFANYRTAGLADMAQAIIEGREARCGLERALHGIDVMTSILKSGETGAFVDLTTTCTRPEPLGPEAARALLV